MLLRADLGDGLEERHTLGFLDLFGSLKAAKRTRSPEACLRQAPFEGSIFV